jgi:hypothetical protein
MDTFTLFITISELLDGHSDHTGGRNIVLIFDILLNLNNIYVFLFCITHTSKNYRQHFVYVYF